MQYIEPGSPAYRKTLVAMLLGSLVTFAVLYSPQTLLGVLAEQYRVTPAMASLTISLTTAALAVGLLFISILANAWGRKKVMTLSLLCTSLLAILSAFSHNFQFLLAVRLLIGFSLAGFPATAIAYLSEECAPRALGAIMGVYVAGTGVGGFVGRVVIGSLTDLCSWQTALFALGTVSLLCSLWFWIGLPDSRHFQSARLSLPGWSRHLQAALRGGGGGNLLSLYGIAFLLMGAYVMLLNYIGFPLRRAPYHLSQTVLGLLFVVNLGGIWSSVLCGKLADRYPRARVLGGAVLLLGGGALLTLAAPLFLKIAGLALFALGFFAGHAVACGWVGLLAPAHCKAQASALYLLFYYGGSSLLGWLGGFAWSLWGWTGVIGLICLLLGLAAFLSRRVTAKETALLPALRHLREVFRVF